MTGGQEIILDEDALRNHSTESIADQLGIGFGRTVSRHCALLCLAASKIISGSGLSSARREQTGLYCVIHDPPPDPKITGLIAVSDEPGYKTLRTNSSPMGFLRSMSVVEAGWVSKICEIRGPVRIFNDEKYGFAQALGQVSVDFELGAVQHALVVHARCASGGEVEEKAEAYLFANEHAGRIALSRLVAKSAGS